MAALRRGLDGAMALLGRVMLRVFFREIRIVGLERLPRGCPRLVVANHVNALVDAMLVIAFLGLRPRILAKNTLWRHPVVAPLLVLVGAVPVYRRQDGINPAGNRRAFRRCRTALAAGGTLVMFPEGTSHNHPHRLPLKTGAARIALETDTGRGLLGLRIVPIGLDYEAKDRFRSRVVIRVGEPIDPAGERELYAEDEPAAVRALTARVAAGIDAVARYGDAPWRGDEAPRSGPARALLAAPMVAGLALNWLPYRLPGWIAARLSRRPDDPATYKLLAALLAFPLAWLLEAVAAGTIGGPAAGLAVGLLAPLSGLAALRYREYR